MWNAEVVCRSSYSRQMFQTSHRFPFLKYYGELLRDIINYVIRREKIASTNSQGSSCLFLFFFKRRPTFFIIKKNNFVTTGCWKKWSVFVCFVFFFIEAAQILHRPSTTHLAWYVRFRAIYTTICIKIQLKKAASRGGSDGKKKPTISLVVVYCPPMFCRTKVKQQRRIEQWHLPVASSIIPFEMAKALKKR